VRHVILGFLLMGPATLYDLHKQFQGGVSQFYSASLGGLRAALSRLVDDGHAVVEERVENGRLKRIHSITDSGRQEFLVWMLRPIEAANPEVTMLAKVYFLGLLTPDQRVTVVRDLRDRVDTELAGLRELSTSLADLELPEQWAQIAHFQIRTLDYGILAHEAAIRWIDSLLAEVEAQS